MKQFGESLLSGVLEDFEAIEARINAMPWDRMVQSWRAGIYRMHERMALRASPWFPKPNPMDTAYEKSAGVPRLKLLAWALPRVERKATLNHETLYLYKCDLCSFIKFEPLIQFFDGKRWYRFCQGGCNK